MELTERILIKKEDLFLKQSIISTIIMLAEKIRGRISVSNLLQYRYDEMMKNSYLELEQIRDSHLKAYNNQLINQ
tara:strand:+ start:2399 stop:2623 length:225 start_codon:yes stop_codon:yes gene_type:complete